MKKRSYLYTIIHDIQSVFLSGFFTILPITLTVGLCTFSFKLLKSWLQPVYSWEPAYLKTIPHSEILVVVVFIFVVGIVLRLFLLQPLIHWFESILGRIPLFRQIYFGIKQLVHALSAQDKFSFQKVVLLEFPRAGIYSLGFLTGELTPALAPKTNEPFYNVFIPTTPNPTTGFYVIVPVKDCIITTMTRQEAMAIIISGGIIQPERLRQ